MCADAQRNMGEIRELHVVSQSRFGVASSLLMHVLLHVSPSESLSLQQLATAQTLIERFGNR